MNEYPAGILGIYRIIHGIRSILHVWLYRHSASRSVIEKDVHRWLDIVMNAEDKAYANWNGIVWLLWKYPEFRSLFYYRIKRERRLITRPLLELAKFIYKPPDSLYIATPSIGAGLFIQHGFSTIIAADRIGENCWINQQVTIGFSSETDRPTLGDNVRVTAGAKVIGKVHIGDNSVVGANAVVVKNVPPNCTVVGVPAYIVKRDGRKVREEL